jgi:hypothetical protein
MEEFLFLAIIALIKTYLADYLIALAAREPVMVLNDFYDVLTGEVTGRKVDGYPACFITPSGDSSYGESLVYTMNEAPIQTYRYQIVILIEGCEYEELEMRAMRYREAIKEMFKANTTLGGVSLGCRITSTDIHTVAVSDSGDLEHGSRLNLDIIAPEFISSFQK